MIMPYTQPCYVNLATCYHIKTFQRRLVYLYIHKTCAGYVNARIKKRNTKHHDGVYGRRVRK